MKYREAVKKAMDLLALDKRVMFVGYNIKFGSRSYGTMKDISFSKCLETPLAENLMVGLATGMSLEGYKPVLFFERHDFLLNGMDGIVNHLDKINKMSLNKFKTPVIIRAVVGGKIPIDPGIQHTQDYTKAIKEMISFPIIELKKVSDIIPTYKKVLKAKGPVMIIEKRDWYESED